MTATTAQVGTPSASSDYEKGGSDDRIESVKDNEVEIAIDPVAEAKLLKKLDWTLLPMFTLIYICNFVDRTSIGNARVAGLEKDLKMKGVELNIALTIFYVVYSASDIPSNLLLKHWGSKWLAFLVLGFGLVSVGAAFLTNYGGLVASRIFLGLFEGGTLSAMIYILSRYYRRKELVMRIGIFFGVGPALSGAFGGLLASGLLRIPNFGFVKTWRKIFLIEGIITVVFGLALFWILPEDPRTTRWLTEEERALALARLDADNIVKNQGKKEKTTLALVLRSFSFITVMCTLAFTLINMSFQGMSLFLPSVINSLGKFTTVEVQLRTVPPYLVGAIWAVGNAYLSHRYRTRWLPLFCNTLLAVAGYAISISTRNSHARYAACFLIIMAGSIVGPMLVIWGTDNAAPDTMRAVVSAAIPGLGAMGAVMGVWTYIPKDAPNYKKGNTGNLATTSTLCVFIIITALYIRWENAKRARGERDHRLVGKTEKELHELGYRHPRFKYQI